MGYTGTGMTKKERDVRYRLLNREKCRASYQKWKEAHPGVSEKRLRKRRAEHPGLSTEYVRRWKELNPGQFRATQARRRARKRGAEVGLTVFEQAAVLAQYVIARARTMQTGIQHHVDHIIPLSKGGKHHPFNLQVLTAAENRRKWTSVY